MSSQRELIFNAIHFYRERVSEDVSFSLNLESQISGGKLKLWRVSSITF